MVSVVGYERPYRGRSLHSRYIHLDCLSSRHQKRPRSSARTVTLVNGSPRPDPGGSKKVGVVLRSEPGSRLVRVLASRLGVLSAGFSPREHLKDLFLLILSCRF